MLPVLYLAVAVGVAFLLLDLLGRLRAGERRVRWWRSISALATLFVGLQPAVFGLRNPDAVMQPLHLIAGAYAASAVLSLVGLAAGARAGAVLCRRIGYAILLALGALPSFLLLFLTPIIAMAGIGLVRPVSRQPGT